MSQPNLQQSFDASLIDMTSTNSGSTTQPNSFSSTDPNLPITITTPTMPSQKQVRHLPTTDAYDLWAPTYDTDGNMLQALDSAALPSLLTALLAALPKPATPNGPLHLTDLGVGTGRATLALLTALQAPNNAAAVRRLLLTSTGAPRTIELACLDPSRGMLAVAQQRIPASSVLTVPPATTSDTPLEVQLRARFAVYAISTAPGATISAGDAPAPPAHGLVSTLVLEHVPLAAYFAAVAALLAPRGAAMVTNMHADMGNAGAPLAGGSQPGTAAGFTDGASGVKIRGESWAHDVKGMEGAAEAVGLRVLGDGVGEEAVTAETVERGVVGERGRKWIGVKCWMGGVFVGSG